ncbi:hypothetical protein K461DRAFT_274192 [Myriangium duriaei CBS 260.36]|uniref:Uncharacterized protein n=1 Tax=Myriangium duriaei CBS 260.36 TaxID=1168546 RepID=A0A9P4MK81_9PEZI|nr:hypothetical protein K461DRAFT_274192 [Myriangium duriaei CBS 260.36]
MHPTTSQGREQFTTSVQHQSNQLTSHEQATMTSQNQPTQLQSSERREGPVTDTRPTTSPANEHSASSAQHQPNQRTSSERREGTVDSETHPATSQGHLQQTTSTQHLPNQPTTSEKREGPASTEARPTTAQGHEQQTAPTQHQPNQQTSSERREGQASSDIRPTLSQSHEQPRASSQRPPHNRKRTAISDNFLDSRRDSATQPNGVKVKRDIHARHRPRPKSRKSTTYMAAAGATPLAKMADLRTDGDFNARRRRKTTTPLYPASTTAIPHARDTPIPNIADASAIADDFNNRRRRKSTRKPLASSTVEDAKFRERRVFHKTIHERSRYTPSMGKMADMDGADLIPKKGPRRKTTQRPYRTSAGSHDAFVDKRASRKTTTKRLHITPAQAGPTPAIRNRHHHHKTSRGLRTTPAARQEEAL